MRFLLYGFFDITYSLLHNLPFHVPSGSIATVHTPLFREVFPHILCGNPEFLSASSKEAAAPATASLPHSSLRLTPYISSKSSHLHPKARPSFITVIARA